MTRHQTNRNLDEPKETMGREDQHQHTYMHTQTPATAASASVQSPSHNRMLETDATDATRTDIQDMTTPAHGTHQRGVKRQREESKDESESTEESAKRTKREDVKVYDSVRTDASDVIPCVFTLNDPNASDITDQDRQIVQDLNLLLHLCRTSTDSHEICEKIQQLINGVYRDIERIAPRLNISISSEEIAGTFVRQMHVLGTNFLEVRQLRYVHIALALGVSTGEFWNCLVKSMKLHDFPQQCTLQASFAALISRDNTLIDRLVSPLVPNTISHQLAMWMIVASGIDLAGDTLSTSSLEAIRNLITAVLMGSGNSTAETLRYALHYICTMIINKHTGEVRLGVNTLFGDNLIRISESLIAFLRQSDPAIRSSAFKLLGLATTQSPMVCEHMVSQNLLTSHNFEIILDGLKADQTTAERMFGLLRAIRASSTAESRSSQPEFIKLLVRLVELTGSLTTNPHDRTSRFHLCCITELHDCMDGVQTDCNKVDEMVQSTNLVPILCQLIAHYPKWTYDQMNENELPIIVAVRLLRLMVNCQPSVNGILHSIIDVMIQTPGTLKAIEGYIRRWLLGYEQSHRSNDAAPVDGPTYNEQSSADECLEIIQFLKIDVYGRVRPITFHQYRVRQYRHRPFPYNRWNCIVLKPCWLAQCNISLLRIRSLSVSDISGGDDDTDDNGDTEDDD